MRKPIFTVCVLTANSLLLWTTNALAESLGDFAVVESPEKVTALRPIQPKLTKPVLPPTPEELNRGGFGGGPRLSLEKAFQFRKHWQLEEELGFHKTDMYDIKADKDPNQIYRKARPLPEIGMIYPPGYDPLSGVSTDVQGVSGWKRRWPWPVPDATRVSSEIVTVWEWHIPQPLKGSYPSFRGNTYQDHYATLCLTALERQRQPREPVLCSFDARSGLRWKVSLPVNAALEEYSKHLGQTILWQKTNGMPDVSMTQDGSRTLAAIGLKTLDMAPQTFSLLFVYGPQGDLLHTRVFPDRVLLGLHRTFSTDLFGLSFQWKPSEAQKKQYRLEMGTTPDISDIYLVDREGNLLRRFVDERGFPVNFLRLSDTHARADQTYLRPDKCVLYFELPRRAD
jgi:hypothetical protein